MFGLKLALPRWPSPKTASEVAPEASAPPKTSGATLTPIASAVVLAAGAGVAFWWWTQWARGRAESEGELVGSDSTAVDAELGNDPQ